MIHDAFTAMGIFLEDNYIVVQKSHVKNEGISPCRKLHTQLAKFFCSDKRS